MRQRSREAAVLEPVFIVGEARSGTSILYRTLQQHPSFRPRTEDLTESNAMALTPRAGLFRVRAKNMKQLRETYAFF